MEHLDDVQAGHDTQQDAEEKKYAFLQEVVGEPSMSKEESEKRWLEHEFKCIGHDHNDEKRMEIEHERGNIQRHAEHQEEDREEQSVAAQTQRRRGPGAQL